MTRVPITMNAVLPNFRLSALMSLLLGATGTVTAHAQAAPADVTLDPVVVTGSGSARRLGEAPYAASVVDSESLRKAGPMVNLSEALVRVPGLIVNQRQNYAQDLQISARGFGARATFGVRGLRLYSDGIPATMPDGQGQVAHFDLAGAERVEVLRGPFSALYGNSSGGVVAVFSAPVTERAAEVGIDWGSDGLRQQRLSMQAPLSGGFDISGSVTHFDTDGLRPQSSAERLLSNLRMGWRGEQDKVIWQLSDQTLTAQDPLGLSLQDFYRNPRGTDPSALQFNTRKTVRQTQTGLSWTHDFRDTGPLAQSQLAGYWGSRGVVQYLAIPVATQANVRHGGGVVDFDRVYHGVDGRLTWRWTGVELITGLNAEDQRDDRRGYNNYTSPTQVGVQGLLRRNELNVARTREGYGQLEWRLAPSLYATGGLRSGKVEMSTTDYYLSNGNDSGERSFRYTTPVLGLRWAVQPGWNLHASAARGYESPTLGELAYTATSGGGFNTALQAQTSRQYEVGSKWRSGGLALDASLFWVDTNNEIGVQTNTGGRSAFQNVGRTRRYGAEVSTQWRFSPQWRAQAALNWLSAKYRDNFLTCAGTPCATPTQPVPAGNRIAGTQPFGAWTELAWSPAWSEGRSEGAVEWRALGRTAATDVNNQFAPGYGVLGLRWLQRWSVGQAGMVEGLARVDNLFDHRYAGSVIVNDANGRYFEPAAGRTLQLSLRYRQGF
jgi:iron complex outermembrane receptor protein